LKMFNVVLFVLYTMYYQYRRVMLVTETELGSTMQPNPFSNSSLLVNTLPPDDN